MSKKKTQRISNRTLENNFACIEFFHPPLRSLKPYYDRQEPICTSRLCLIRPRCTNCAQRYITCIMQFYDFLWPMPKIKQYSKYSLFLYTRRLLVVLQPKDHPLSLSLSLTKRYTDGMRNGEKGRIDEYTRYLRRLNSFN